MLHHIQHDLFLFFLTQKSPIDKRTRQFARESIGLFRLFTVLNAILAGILFIALLSDTSKEIGNRLLIFILDAVILVIGSWFLLRTCLWVYDGFKQKS